MRNLILRILAPIGWAILAVWIKNTAALPVILCKTKNESAISISTSLENICTFSLCLYQRSVHAFELLNKPLGVFSLEMSNNGKADLNQDSHIW